MESKYLNQQTLSYLQAQTGQTTAQRLEALENAVQNISTYLEQQQKFLADYETYLEGEIHNQIALSTQIQAEVKRINNNTTGIGDSFLRLSKKVTYLVIGFSLAILTLCFLK